MRHSTAGERDSERRPACELCGAVAPSAAIPLTWSTSVEAGGRRQLHCDRCVRENARAIEGRLDAAWW